MPKFVSTSVTTEVDDNDDQVYIAPTGSVIAASTQDAIYVTGDDTVDVFGTVIGAEAGVQFNIDIEDNPPPPTDLNLYVGASGTIAGLAAVLAVGNVFLENHGQIVGFGPSAGQYGVGFFGDAGRTVLNYGSISGQTAIDAGDASGALVFENYGQLSGESNALQGGEEDDTVVNYGTISGTLHFGDGAGGSLVNHGAIVGDVYTPNGTPITNAGTLVGLVTDLDAAISLIGAQISLNGGGDSISFDRSGLDGVTISNTDGNWDSVSGSNGVIRLDGAQASVLNDDDTVYLDGSASDIVSLYARTGWSTVYGSGGEVLLSDTMASVVGGGDSLYLLGSRPAADAVSLYNTNQNWDVVHGANAYVILSSAQAALFGGNLSVTLNGSTLNAVSLNATDDVWDAVSGDNGVVAVASSQATISGSNDTIYLGGTGSVVSLYKTVAGADSVSGSNATIILTSASANLQGGSDTLAFQAAYGLDTLGGYAASDKLQFSKSDWASFSALQASGDLTQVGGNAQIRLDSADVLTLTGVTASSLTAGNFSFV